MEQEVNQGMCEHQDSEDRVMGSDFENTEDRERDPEERGMGSNSQDAEERGHLEQEMGSNPQDEALSEDLREREVVSDICTGEAVGISPLTCTSCSLELQPGAAFFVGSFLETIKQDSILT